MSIEKTKAEEYLKYYNNETLDELVGKDGYDNHPPKDIKYMFAKPLKEREPQQPRDGIYYLVKRYFGWLDE